MKTKWIVPFLLAVMVFSMVSNLVAVRRIKNLEIENQIYAQNIDILKQKIADCISDRDAAVRAAVPAAK